MESESDVSVEDSDAMHAATCMSVLSSVLRIVSEHSMRHSDDTLFSVDGEGDESEREVRCDSDDVYESDDDSDGDNDDDDNDGDSDDDDGGGAVMAVKK